MKILNITAIKKPLGAEDIAIGTGHILQTRNGVEKTYHKVPVQCDMGLLADCKFEEISSDLTELYFSGYYEEGDYGEGIYKKVGVGTDHNTGIYITNGSVVWKRQYDTYVRPEWFGAKGDGVSDDAEAFIIALMYGAIELGHNKHYRCELLKVNTIPITQNIDIIGNQATVEVVSILDSNKLIFQLVNNIQIRCEFVTFKSNLEKIFHFYSEREADLKYCTFVPSSINPFKSTSYLMQKSEQYIQAKYLEGRHYKTQVATNDLHPINKNDLKSLKLEKVENAVEVKGDVTITVSKVFYKSPQGPDAVDDDQVVTLYQLQQLMKLPQATKDVINSWLQSLKNSQGSYGKNECPYPTSAIYIQPFGTKEPSELWPGTEWVKLEYNDGALIYNEFEVNNSGQLFGTNGKESINAKQ